MKRLFLSSITILAFAATSHADELLDVQAQAKQLTKRLADLEKRQKTLETQKVVLPSIAPVDAMAADLPYKAAVKAKPPEDDGICVKGICVYGNFDMGAAYINHSAPVNALGFGTLEYLAEKPSYGSYAGVASNMMSISFIGLRGKQEIADNLYAVFNLQTLFNPISGMNANQIGGIVQNNGVPNALQNSYADSSKAGQMFNNAAYFGISSPTYGTFTMGRQSALSSDLVVNYDPISNSGAWSIIAYEGAAGGGGDTENRIFDNSYEYRLNVGPLRLAAEAQLRNGGNSPTGNAFQSGVGFDYAGFSMDFVAGKIYDAMLVPGPLSTAQMGALANNQAGVAGFGGPGYAISCSLGCLSGTISDNTVFQVAAKYTIGPWKFYAGYDHTTYANPDNPLNGGAFAFGGYNVAFANNDFYASNKNLNIFWVGAKYAVTSNLDVTAAYYGERAGYFTVGASPSTAAGTTFASSPGQAASTNAAQAAACAANSAASSGCAGGLDMISVVLDWRFARHMDLYAGVSWLQKFGGFVSGYQLSTNNSTLTGGNVNTRASTFDPGIGLRYQF